MKNRHTLFCGPMLAIACVLSLVALSAATALGQQIIYVRAAAPAGGDGATWATAHQEVTAALAQASALPAETRNVQVWIGSGIYRPAPIGGARTSTFLVDKGVALFGGFGGTEATLDERRISTFVTTLSGDIGRNGAITTDDAYHVVTFPANTTAGSLDGLTIERGNADGPTGLDTDGGGVVVRVPSSGVVITRCTIRNCRASSVGGALYIGDDTSTFVGNVTLENCLLNSNTAPIGGALHQSFSNLTLRHCTIASNTTTSGGAFGATIFARGGAITMTNSIVSANTHSAQFYTGVDAGTYTVDHSLLQTAFAGAGNITGDPLFQSPGFGVYRLNATSPCIDAGVNATLPIHDRDGAYRLVDGNADGAAIVDMGAFEFRSASNVATIFVNQNATGANNGQTWADAFSGPLALQSALAHTSKFTGFAAQIWVTAGVHKPALPGAARSSRVFLRRSVGVYGGFIGTETQLTQRDSAANVTTLSGDLNGDDLGELNIGDNCATIVSFPADSDLSVVLDGFTIRQANNNTSSGGAFIIPATGGATGFTVRSCIVEANRAQSGAAGQLASVNPPSGGFRFENCVFRSNVATGALSGAGAGGVGVNASKGRFVSCDFIENSSATNIGSADPSGGALRVFNGSEVIVEGCRFIRNSGAIGSAVVVQDLSTLTLTNCSVLGNTTLLHGAVVGSDRSRLTLVSTLFAANRAQAGSGAVFSTNLGSLASSNSFFRATNCTFVANHSAGAAGSSFAGAVGLENLDSHTSTLANCLVWGNTSSVASGRQVQVSVTGADPVIGTSSIQDLESGYGGGALNDDLNPLFLRAPGPGNDLTFGTSDDDYGDLRPGAGSPAIDSGESAALPTDSTDLDRDGIVSELLPLDLSGFPRLVDDPGTLNTGPGGSPHVDRGVYEVQINCLACPGVREWRTPAGGLFSEVVNWFPSVPNSTHDALFNLNATYTITLGAATGTTVSNKSATFNAGNVTLDLDAATYALTTTAATSLVVGNDDNSTATLNITDGRLTAATAAIARGIGSTATVNVSGSAARLVVAPLDLYVGFNGDGALNITGGAQVTSRIASVAILPGSSGSVLVDGPGSLWTVPFYLTVDNGTVTVRNGGTLNAGFGIFLLQNATLNGDGTIIGDVVNFGAVEPGNSPGTLTINGAYTQVGEIPDFGSSSGKLTMQVNGTAPGQFDRLVVQGPTQLGGGLIVESPAGGFPTPPEAGLSLPIIDALGGIAPSDITGLPADHFDVAFFPRVPGAMGGPSDKFLKLERPEGAGAAFFTLTTGTLGAPINVNDPSNTSATATPSSVTPADLDGDGLDDLAITTPSTNSIVILMNRGTLSGQWQGFEGAVQFAVGVNPQGTSFGDINGDGRPDLVVANTGSDSVSLFQNNTVVGSHTIALASQGTLSTGDGPTGVDLNFFDGSGTRPVIITADELGGQISLLVRGPAPGFTFQPRIEKPIPVATPPRQPRNLDIDGDGAHPDLALLSVDGSSVVVLQNISVGNGIVAFADPIILPVDEGPSQLEVARLRDGRSSLVTVNSVANTISVLVNSADLLNPVRFAPAVNVPAGLSPLSLVSLDVDADTDADLAVLTNTGEGANPIKVRLFRNDYLVGTVQENEQVTFVNDRDLPDDGAPTDAVFVIAARLASPMVTDLLTVNSQGGQRGPGEMALNVRPRLNATNGGGVNTCLTDFNNDGIVSPDDLDEFITTYFSEPPDNATADFNNDGIVSPDDLDEFITSYFGGC